MMITVNVRGGLAGIAGLTEWQYKRVAGALTFQKKDYRTGEQKDIQCYLPRAFDNLPQMLVPRCFNSRTKFRDVLYDYKYGSEGRSLGQSHCEQMGEWNGINQEEFVGGAVSATMNNQFGGICIAPCGTGKTRMGLEIIRRLGRSALVVLSRKFQIDQWKTEAKAMKISVGTYSTKRQQSGKDFDVVVGLINSLHKESLEEFFRTFGTTVIDECHHAPANTWTALVSRLTSKNILGVSAGLHRSDRMNSLFEVLLGPAIVNVDQKRNRGGEVHQIVLTTGTCRSEMRTDIDRTTVAKVLSRHKKRNASVLKEVVEASRAGRNILVFSDLVREHLIPLHYAAMCAGLDAKLYSGDSSNIERKQAEQAQITFISYSMANEGLDFPRKDTIICATPPTANLLQLKGRIDREMGGKKPPLIVDFVDDNAVLVAKASARKNGWAKLGLEVKIKKETNGAKTSV